MGKYDFEGARDATPSRGGVYMKPGNYRVQIQASKWIKGQLGKNFFIVEFKILKSDNPEVPVGAQRSWVVDMSTSNVMRGPNVKGFIAAVSGVDGSLDDAADRIEEYWRAQSGADLGFEAIMGELVIDQNILENVEMDLECVNISTRTGGEFTKFNWATNPNP